MVRPHGPLAAGRLYVGYLAPGLDQQHCLAPLAAVLLAAPRAVFEGQPDADDLLDAWWTQVVYHGSLRGVGASHNAFVTDVRTLLRRLDAERAQAARGGAALPASGASGSAAAADGARLQPAVAQLTSRSSAQENARTFDRLAAPRGAPDCLDAVLATNMLSVGVDVDRLAAMVINGQPLTTAEYIQASSRIGRGGVPGLVVANYFRHQARSLSHYENFRPYHESFYRFVEPTSVTPFTYQVRKRALHAALVTALRHGCGDLTANDAAGRFRRDDAQVQAAVEALKRRCRRAAGDAADDTARHLDRLVDEWHDEAARCRRENRGCATMAGSERRPPAGHVRRRAAGPLEDAQFDAQRRRHHPAVGEAARCRAARRLRGQGVMAAGASAKSGSGGGPPRGRDAMADEPIPARADRGGTHLAQVGRNAMADEPIPVRLSHLLRYCGVGAVVRGPDYLVTVKDTRTWTCGVEHQIQHVEQVRAVLGIDGTLRSPPVARIEDGRPTGRPIPAMRFPGWMRCARCGLLRYRPWRRASGAAPDPPRRPPGQSSVCADGDRPACPGRLEQAPWVLAHACGYLADVPWHRLAHAGSRHPDQCGCRADREDPYLRVVAADRGYTVRCRRCGASGPLPQRFPFGEEVWRQPWFPEPAGPLDEPAWVLEINDVRVHAPDTVTALVIPPESRIRRGTVVDRLFGSADQQAALRGARAGLQRKTVLRRIARDLRCAPDDVEEALAGIDRGYPLYGSPSPAVTCCGASTGPWSRRSRTCAKTRTS